MTLFERALGLFTTTQKSTRNFELLEVTDIVSSISNSSNNWNMAAALLAADHEQNPRKRVTIVCYPTTNIGPPIEFPKLSTLEWNALALALLEKSDRARSESSNTAFHADAAR